MAILVQLQYYLNHVYITASFNLTFFIISILIYQFFVSELNFYPQSGVYLVFVLVYLMSYFNILLNFR